MNEVQNSCFQYAELSSAFNVWRRVNRRERTRERAVIRYWAAVEQHRRGESGGSFAHRQNVLPRRATHSRRRAHRVSELRARLAGRWGSLGTVGERPFGRCTERCAVRFVSS